MRQNFVSNYTGEEPDGMLVALPRGEHRLVRMLI